MKLYTMKRMLVCTDLTESSDIVLRAAEKMRQRNGGSIDLLYVSELGFQFEGVMNDSFKNTYRDIFLGGIKTSIEEKIDAQLKRCGVEGRSIIRDGKVDKVIAEEADKGLHDLIIMGHGQKPYIQRILGSNALKLASHAPIPLFIVKKDPLFSKAAGLIDESRSLDKIIIGTYDFCANFKYESSAFISLWMDFPEPFGTSEGSQIESRIRSEVEHFADRGEKAQVIIKPTRELKVADPLHEILISEKVDSIVLKKFSGPNLSRIYIGSTTKRLLEVFEGNILVLPT